MYIYTHTCNRMLLSYQKELNNAICNNMDGPRYYHTKQSEKDKYYITYMSKYKEYLYFSKIKHNTNQINRNVSLDNTALVTLP